MLIDVAISKDRKMIKKEAEILKYTELTRDIQYMWNIKAKQYQ
jgi:hypothetical protein